MRAILPCRWANDALDPEPLSCLALVWLFIGLSAMNEGRKDGGTRLEILSVTTRSCRTRKVIQGGRMEEVLRSRRFDRVFVCT